MRQSNSLHVIGLFLVIHILLSATIILNEQELSAFFHENLFVNNENEEQNKKTIKIGLGQFSGNAPLVIAQEKFFKENNVKAELILMENASLAQKMYIDGDTDGRSDVWPDTIFYSSRGYDPKLVFVLDYSTSADALVSNQNDIMDLKGKKLELKALVPSPIFLFYKL